MRSVAPAPAIAGIAEHDRAVYRRRLRQARSQASVAGGLIRKIAPVWGQLTRWANDLNRRVERDGYVPNRAEQELYDRYQEAKNVDLQSAQRGGVPSLP